MALDADGQSLVDQPLRGQSCGPRKLVRRLNTVVDPAYSICTMLTNPDEYRGMAASLVAHGFTEADCEFLVLDNSAGNLADAYVATNEFLQSARAGRIILCHQDILLLADGRAELDARLDELDRIDPDWALAGNAGMTAAGWPITCISDPNNPASIFGGPLPARVVSLDENFIVARRAANLAVSRDLAGFHHYGSDLCMVADVLGWNAHVIDFLLRHNSTGTVDQRYYASADAVRAKYARALRPRWVPTIIGEHMFLSGSGAGTRRARLLRQIGKLLGRVPRNRDLWQDGRRTAQDRHRDALSRLER